MIPLLFETALCLKPPSLISRRHRKRLFFNSSSFRHYPVVVSSFLPCIQPFLTYTVLARPQPLRNPSPNLEADLYKTAPKMSIITIAATSKAMCSWLKPPSILVSAVCEQDKLRMMVFTQDDF